MSRFELCGLISFIFMDGYVFFGSSASSCLGKNALSAFRSNRLTIAWNLENIVTLNDVIQFLDEGILLGLSSVGVMERTQRK